MSHSVASGRAGQGQPARGVHAEPVHESRHADTGDGFIDDFLNRLPSDLADSFTREQLNAVRMVYGARRPTPHHVDVRRLVNLGPRSFYVVLLMGRASPRQRGRLELARNPVRRAANWLLLVAAGALAGYIATLNGWVPPF